MAENKWVTEGYKPYKWSYTLPPIIMEVENGVLEDVFSLQMGYFPLP